MSDQSAALAPLGPKTHEKFLFASCFVALVATSFAFFIRTQLIGDWQLAFGLSETQKGQILGAGLWPFGISIVLFSLVVDKIGYRRSMIFAFLCHVASALLMITAKGYWGLYIGSLLNGLAAGTVEAIINPAVATMFPKNKPKMLSILHAGWPGGMVLCGILLMAGMGSASWQAKVALMFIPVIAYGVMLLWCKFPVSERVAAGVSYHDMLKEAGALGALVVSTLIVIQLASEYEALTSSTVHWLVIAAAVAVISIGYLIYTKSLGRILYIVLLLVMMLSAITELGTDSWVSDLMGPAMADIGLKGMWLLLYTQVIMMVLRLCGGPIVHKLKPLGVLFVGAIIAMIGLFFLSTSTGIMILVMATFYGLGKTFFWPMTIGTVGEQFPKGGALTLNAIGGVGMLAAGVIGGPLLGYLQDSRIERNLKAENPAVYEQVMSKQEQKSVWGSYYKLDSAVVQAMNDKVALYDTKMKVAEKAAAELDKGLAASQDYKNAVNVVCLHLLPPGSTLEKEKLTGFPEQLAYLKTKGYIVGENEYQKDKEAVALVGKVTIGAKKNAMSTTAVLPLIMAGCYLGLIIYFRAKGGYKPVELVATKP